MIIVEKKEYQIGVEKKQIIIEMSQRGPSGPRGLKGDTGEQGPQGEKGDPGPKGDPGVTTWGSITGSLQNQIDLNLALAEKAESVHQHGYIASNGKIIGGAVVITNGDRMLISDASNGNSVAMTNTVFDGVSTDKALTQKGTFESFITPSIICDAETSMIATRDYTEGSLIIVGKTLYLTLVNIASGSALSVGSNVSETTLAEYIISLIS